MNPIDINLLPSTDILSRSQKNLRRNLSLVAISLGIVVVVGWLVVFGLARLAQSQVSSLQTQRQELVLKFEDNVPKLNRLLSLKDKLGGIKKVQSVRPSLSAAINAQQGLLVDGVSTTKLAVNTSGQMTFDVTVRDLKSLSSYLTKLDSDQARNFFKTLAIGSLVLGQDGSFTFSVESQFDPAKLLSQS